MKGAGSIKLDVDLRTKRPRHVIDLRDDVTRTDTLKLRPIPRSKRLLDIVMSAVGLILSSPLWLVIAIAIKLDDRGPIFYRQRRWGRGAQEFGLFKFRTMVPDSDERYGIRLAEVNDNRVTRVGKLLRATGMDELPQFLNIFKGDMSFVGPRALAVGEVLFDDKGRVIDYDSIPGFRKRLTVQPGLTGLATIYLPKDASPDEKLGVDLAYIEDWSFWGDIKLILTSFSISLRGKWETRDNKTRSPREVQETEPFPRTGTSRT